MAIPYAPRLFAALAVALVLAGALLRIINLGGPALCCDEFFDVFAGQRWIEGRGFQTPDREYTRGLMMTRATGASFALFGQSEWRARIPALIMGVLTLPLIALSGRALFGPVAALVALGFLAVSPHGIDVSRFARLYSPVTFLLLGGATDIGWRGATIAVPSCACPASPGFSAAASRSWPARIFIPSPLRSGRPSSCTSACVPRTRLPAAIGLPPPSTRSSSPA